MAGEELPADGVVALDETGGGAVEGGAVLFRDDGAGEDGGRVVCDLEVGGGAGLGIAKTLERVGEGGGGESAELGGGGGAAEAGAVEAHDADHAEPLLESVATSGSEMQLTAAFATAPVALSFSDWRAWSPTAGMVVNALL